MKLLVLFISLMNCCSCILAMAPDPVSHIQKQVNQLKAEGLNTNEIAQIATNSLGELLEYPLVYFPIESYISQYKTLVEAGGNKNVQHPTSGKTALMFAVVDNRPDIVQELLALGVDLEIQDNNGNTALQQYPVINERSLPQIRHLLEEARIAQQTQKSKLS